MEQTDIGMRRDGEPPRPGRIARAAGAALLAIVLAAGLLPPALGSAFASEEAANAPEPAGIIVVVEEDGATTLSADADAAESAAAVVDELEDAGMTVTGQTERSDGSILVSAEPADGESAEDALARAADLPGVSSVQLDYSYELIDGVESDSEEGDAAKLLRLTADALGDAAGILSFRPFNDPYALEASADASPNAYWLYTTNLVEAWSAAATTNPVAIAVIDTGIAASHEDLAAAIRTDLAWDSYNGKPLDTTAFSEGDNGGHGTHVAGIAAAVPNNGVGTAGASYGATIVPVKVVGDTTTRLASTTSLIRAYEYLFEIIDGGRVEGLRVVNLSLGSYSEAMNDTLLRTTIERARNVYGIVTVCAGGNGENNRPVTDPIYPADFDACVSVTALTAEGMNISWSDYNEYKDISAPGEYIWATYPVSLTRSTAYPGYYAQSGTSMAAPIVAGTFALLFSIDPDATVDEACEAIYETAREIVDPDNDRRETSGSHGAIDAAAAVEYLTGLDLDAGDYPDVASNAWYADAVAYVSQRGVMSGYDEGAGELAGYFAPEAIVTRAQAAQMLYNLYADGAVADPTDKPDVNQSAWYATAVNWVVSSGLMTGYDDGTNRFAPDATLTREQLAIVLFRASEVTSIANPDAFAALEGSEETSPWAVEEMTWAVGNGVINGSEVEPGRRVLLPQNGTTRAMVAQVFMNAIEAGIL